METDLTEKCELVIQKIQRLQNYLDQCISDRTAAKEYNNEDRKRIEDEITHRPT